MNACSVARNIYVVAETMASFDEERTTNAADSGDSSDANKPNNGGIERSLYDLNGENSNICRVNNASGDTACSDSSIKMEENQLNVVPSTTTTEIDGVQKGTSSSIEDNANAENNSIMTQVESIQWPLATQSVANHVEKIISPVCTSEKHVSSDKLKNSSSARHASVGTKNSSKSPPTNCGKFECILFRIISVNIDLINLLCRRLGTYSQEKEERS